MKKCPYCAEEIQDEAKVCKHCGRDLVSAATAQKVEIVQPKAKTGCGTWLVAIFFALLFMGWCTTAFRSPSTPATGQAPAAPAAETAAGTPSGTSPGTVTPPKPGGKWREVAQTSQMDDSKGVSFHLEAENSIQGWLKGGKPTLIVRCQEKSTNVFMVTGMAASVESGDLEGHTVRVRYDDAPPQRQRWSESTDNEALFAPRAQQMARALASAKALRIEFTPFNASPATVTFDVSGFQEHVGKVASACGWKP